MIERTWLYHVTCRGGRLFEGRAAIEAARADGWVDTPQQLPPPEPDVVDGPSDRRTVLPAPGTTCVEDVARIAHEVNRAYCRALGDDSQPAWADAPDWQRESAIAGVRFLLEHPAAPPSASHDNWLAQKQAEGWTYGETKDAEAKTHPCMRPFDELPVEQQAKDHIFTAIVRLMADLFGLGTVPVEPEPKSSRKRARKR